MNDNFKTITSKEELKERLVSDTGYSINDVTDYVYNHLGSWEDLVQEVGIEKIDEDYYDTLVEDLGDYLRD